LHAPARFLRLSKRVTSTMNIENLRARILVLLIVAIAAVVSMWAMSAP
jgi:hypothetical protein